MTEPIPGTTPITRFAPVAPTERIAAVDVLRGFALLGILVINVPVFALPAATLFNPLVGGGFAGLDQLAWKFNYVVFFQKMMAIFSMLFGAGMVLMSGRAESSGVKFTGVYYRRILWLAIFGLIHAYFVWYGDILFTYAVAGLLLYPLRRLRAKWLVVLGAVVLIFGASLLFGSGHLFEYMRHQHQAAEVTRQEGGTPDPLQQNFSRSWQEINAEMNPTGEKIAGEIAARRGSYWEMTSHAASQALATQTQALVFFGLWRALGQMLLGMGLMKLGVFSAQRSFRFYATLAIIGYGVAMPVSGLSASLLIAHNFDFPYYWHSGGLIDYFSSVFVGLGHVGLVMIICRLGLFKAVTSRLAAIGRTALTNYLLQSLIMGLIFYGCGLGLFGQVNRAALWLFVLGTWVVQLIISPIWLARYRFGPMEWLWRTLTYFRRQPLRG